MEEKNRNPSENKSSVASTVIYYAVIVLLAVALVVGLYFGIRSILKERDLGDFYVGPNYCGAPVVMGTDGKGSIKYDHIVSDIESKFDVPGMKDSVNWLEYGDLDHVVINVRQKDLLVFGVYKWAEKITVTGWIGDACDNAVSFHAEHLKQPVTFVIEGTKTPAWAKDSRVVAIPRATFEKVVPKRIDGNAAQIVFFKDGSVELSGVLDVPDNMVYAIGFENGGMTLYSKSKLYQKYYPEKISISGTSAASFVKDATVGIDDICKNAIVYVSAVKDEASGEYNPVLTWVVVKVGVNYGAEPVYFDLGSGTQLWTLAKRVVLDESEVGRHDGSAFLEFKRESGEGFVNAEHSRVVNKSSYESVFGA